MHFILIAAAIVISTGQVIRQVKRKQKTKNWEARLREGMKVNSVTVMGD